jgi:hypothetical protein
MTSETFWLLTLLIPEPSAMDSSFRDIAKRNGAIRYAIASGSVDFEAADLADRINVVNLTAAGTVQEANHIEALRQQRIQARQRELQNQALVAAIRRREAALQQQIDMLSQRIDQAQSEANRAR